MKLLLVGGGGYIGSALVPVLMERGYDLDVADAFWFGDYLPREVPRIRTVLWDLKPEDLKQYDQVLFLAGISNDPMAELDPAGNFVLNAALPAYIAYIAKLAGVKRYIYASSCSIYGYTVNKVYDEASPVTCNYPYGISKLQGERGVFQMYDEKFSVIALRQGTVSGYSPRMRFDLIVNTMFKTCIADFCITINNPSIWRPIADIRDIVNAWTRAVQADYSISGAFNISSGNYTVGQVADIVKIMMEKIRPSTIPITLIQHNVQDIRNYKVSIENAKTILGYEPSYGIKDIVENLYEHMPYGDFNDDRYYNIKVFMKLPRWA